MHHTGKTRVRRVLLCGVLAWVNPEETLSAKRMRHLAAEELANAAM